MRTDTGTRKVVVALAREASKLKAVELVREDEAFKIVRVSSVEERGANWQGFAAECGLSVGHLERAQSVSNKRVVVGFDSAGVGFYRIFVPAAGEEEVSAMVRLQAEALLPLSAEQMEMAWRAGRTQNGEVAVTIAAARKERLQRFVGDVESFQPAKILLSSEGIVKVWRKIFGGDDNTSVVVNLSERNTQVCLAQEGRLSNAAALDIGMKDLSAPEGQTEIFERFAQDMRSVLKLFGCAESADVPIFVLSDGSDAIGEIVSCLSAAGLNARAALPDEKELKTKTGFGVEDVYEYRVPIGLGLCAFDDDEDELNIFERLYEPAKVEEQKHWIYSPKAAGAITIAVLIVFLLISYAIDMAGPKAIEKRLQTADSGPDVKQLIERQNLMKIVAQQRPDMLDIFNQITASGEKGIMLDSLHFKKGQPVNISGQVRSSDQLYKFQENLLGQKNIKEVKIQNTSKDNKNGKIKFTITFHYKNFTRKGRT